MTVSVLAESHGEYEIPRFWAQGLSRGLLLAAAVLAAAVLAALATQFVKSLQRVLLSTSDMHPVLPRLSYKSSRGPWW